MEASTKTALIVAAATVLGGFAQAWVAWIRNRRKRERDRGNP